MIFTVGTLFGTTNTTAFIAATAVRRTFGTIIMFTVAAIIGVVSTNWASQLPIQVVQQLAGHSDITTTRKYYLTVRSEDMVSANKVVNSIFTESSAN